MKEKPMPINTVEKAVRLARALRRDLVSGEPRARRRYRVFAALTPNEPEAYAAYLIWLAQRAILDELSRGP